jgi:hypothetical protein
MNGVTAIIYALLGVAAAVVHAAAPEPLTTEAIAEKIAAIGVRSVQSARGHLVVSGPDALGNAALLSLAEETAMAVEALTGLDLPFDRQSVRILVLPESVVPQVTAVLEHIFQGGGWIHRVVLADYGVMESAAAAECLCAAFLSVYRGSASSDVDGLRVPEWLRRGVLRGLTVAGRQETMDAALVRWQEGRLPSPAMILAGVPDPESGMAGDGAVADGAFVFWMGGFPERAVRFASLFRRLSEKKPLDMDWVREWLPGSGDPDEQWDCWMLSQRTVVRGVGTVSLAQFDQLYAEWLVYPGRGGVPYRARLSPASDCTVLGAYRDEAWFRAVVREKRHRIEMLAPGRALRFQALTAAYVRVLISLENGDPAEKVESLAADARRQWVDLREMVREAGGVWAEP